MGKKMDAPYVTVEKKRSSSVPAVAVRRLTQHKMTPEDVFDFVEAAMRDGNLKLIQHLNDILQEENYKVIDLKNSQQQSPIHLLSITGGSCDGATCRIDMANLFYSWTGRNDGENSLSNLQLAVFNGKDSQQRTPLHYAAKFRRKRLLEWFVQKNLLQSIFDEDEDKLSPLAYLVTSRRLDLVPVVKLIWETASKFVTFRGSSPLHLAAKSSSLEMLELLVEFCGFNADEYDAEGYTALHSAIRHSDESTETCFQRVIYLMQKTSSDKYLTNATNNSPLHIAAMYGKPRMLEFLLNVSVESTSKFRKDFESSNRFPKSTGFHFDKDDERKSFLRLSCLNAARQTCLHVTPNKTVSQGSVDCVKLILSHPDLEYIKEREKFCLQKDDNCQTALQIAAKFETVQICQEILKTLKCHAQAGWLKGGILLPIYRKIPDALVPVFENCLQPRNDYSRREEQITLDLCLIVGERKHTHGCPTKIIPETLLLHQVNSLPGKIRNKVYGNTVVQKFITEKFNCLKTFVIAGVIFQVLYICMFIAFAYTVEECENSTITTLSNSTIAGCGPPHFSRAQNGLAILTLILASLFLVKEFYQLSRNVKLHFKKPSNVVQLAFNLLTFYCVISLLLVNSGQVLPYALLRILTAAIVLMGGALCLYELKKLNWFPSFLRIFLQVAKRSASLLTYYSLLILAFTVVFKILSPLNEDYKLFHGLIKVLAMMVGEYEFEGNFKMSANDPSYDDTLLVNAKLVAFALFIFIAAIVGLNLLIGLAVEDIQALRVDAQLEVLSCQLGHLFNMEQFLLSLQPILPTKIFYWILDRINLIVNTKRAKTDGSYDTKFDFPIDYSI